MQDDDISKLFERVAEHFKDADDSTRRMFLMLVQVALKFRDKLVKEKGTPLTIEETKEALGVFMDVLKARKFPEHLKKNVHDLVVLWLKEIKATRSN